VSENRAIHPVATLCRVLGVSSSGYYAWSKRTPSRRAKDNAGLIERVRAIHAACKGTYGAPRIHAELKANGVHVGKKRVARLMRQAGLAGVSRRRFVTTTVRDGARQAPDLVERDFTAKRPTFRRGPASSTWQSHSMRSAAASSAGQWRRPCTPNSCSMP
jgi:putative transposase